MSDNPTYLDLDAVVPPQKVVKFGGEKYAIRETNLEDFIANTRLAQSLGSDATMVDELEASVQMLVRSVEGITEAQVRKLTFPQMQAILEFVRDANGQVAAEAEAKAATENDSAATAQNPPSAGT